jgi:hypothetical protein
VEPVPRPTTCPSDTNWIAHSAAFLLESSVTTGHPSQ